MGEVLACVDFSDVTERVITAAIRLAAATDLTVRLVHIASAEAELAGYDKEAFEAKTPDKRAGQLRDEHGRLDELTDRLANGGVTTAEPVLVMGHTAEQIVRLAEEFEAELVMIGSHGHGSLHHLLMGSVTEDLLRRSTRPVIVVPARQ